MKNEKTNGFRHEGHKLVSRRDFLGQGMVAGLGMVVTPSLLSLLSPAAAEAQAVGCVAAQGGAGRIPFLVFDLAGGANIATSNVIVGGPGGQMDPLDPAGYEKMGLPSGMFPTDPGQIDTSLGIAFHSDSAILRGIQTRASAGAQAGTNGSILCVRSDNDTGNNPHNPMYGIGASGSNGDLVQLIGTESSDSGGRSDVPMSMFDPSMRPTKVSRSSEATALVDAGRLSQLLDTQEAVSVMQTVEGLSALKVAQLNEGQALADVLDCGYQQTTDLVNRYGDPTLLDPELDPLIVGQAGSIFTQQELNQSSSFESTAAVMKLVMNGFAGAGTVESGGYDYHDGSRATGEVRDFRAGVMIGAALEYAARLNTPLMIYVLSDGSVAAGSEIDNSNDGRGKFVWQGDSSSTASTLMLVYNPGGRPQLTRAEANQLGHFRANGSVETTAIRPADNVGLIPEAVVLNYLALHDEIGRINEVMPNQGLGMGTDLDELVAFQPIR
jgi:hypothetical protein